MIGSFIRQAIGVYRKKQQPAFVRKRSRKLPVTTRQWLVLSFGIAALVALIFIITLLYLQPGR